jgi:hypothetical protein
LKQKKIDILKIKLNPLIVNQGVKLFEGVRTQYLLQLEECELFDDGMQIITYAFSNK